MLENLSKTDQVLVLLNRLAVANENPGQYASSFDPPLTQNRGSIVGLQQNNASPAVPRSSVKGVSYDITQPSAGGSFFQKEGQAPRASYVAVNKPSEAAVRVVLGDQSHPAARRSSNAQRRLRCTLVARHCMEDFSVGLFSHSDLPEAVIPHKYRA